MFACRALIGLVFVVSEELKADIARIPDITELLQAASVFLQSCAVRDYAAEALEKIGAVSL